MDDYTYAITDLEWSESSHDLPEVTVVYISEDIVHAQHIDDKAWEKAINDQLTVRYGQPAVSFGSAPTDLGDYEEFVSELSCVTPLEAFHSPSDNVLLFAVAAGEDGQLAIELLEEAIGEAQDSFTLTCDAGKFYSLTATNLDGLDDLAAAFIDKWDFVTDKSSGEFGEQEEPRELRVYTRGDDFLISKIVWVSPQSDLPVDASVVLPSWLVSAERNVATSEWNREINDQLQAKFGSRAKSFGFARA